MIDALEALENFDTADAPSSLRGTSIVLLGCLASPVAFNAVTGYYGELQRPLLGAFLFLAAMLGKHETTRFLRVSDAAYCTLCCFATIGLFSAGGVDQQAKHAAAEATTRAIKKSSALLASALLLYASLRILRAALVHVDAAHAATVGASVNDTIIGVQAYALASHEAVTITAFGGAVGIGAAITLFWHENELAHGTANLGFQMCVSALAVAACGLIAGLTASEQFAALPAVFGPDACASTITSDLCRAAAESRRLAIHNTPNAALFFVASGLFALADGQPPDLGVVFTVAAIIVAVRIAADLSFVGLGAHVDTAVLVALLSAWWSAVVDHWTGMLLFAVTFGAELVFWSVDYGAFAVFTQLTNVTLLVLVALAVVYLCVSSINALCFRGASRVLRVTTDVTVTAGTSLSIALFLGTAALTASYNGALLQRALPGRREAIVFAFQHVLPAFCWLPVALARREQTTRFRVAWLVPPFVVLVVYSIVLGALQTLPPVLSNTDTPSFVVSLLVGSVGWGLVGEVI